ncbi:MAG: NAD(P)-dependent oxidoreductase, partial [Spirochaetaceae bacterium]|nr:NAD(P)-dependent oxidoreductase [Spirochaetaceae bacterium]
MFATASRLKYVIRGGVGVDTIDIEAAKARGVDVDNTPEASSLAVAELAFALMISLPCRIAEADASMKKGQWLKKEMERTELGGKTLGLVGIGRIARELASRAKAFGMNVISYDKYVSACEVAEMVGFDQLLERSDYISLHAPLTGETKGMIGPAALAKMKKGAYLVNTSRGPLVDEAAVAAALAAGRLGGYAADVYANEPPQGSPLLSAPRVVLTPHIGASTEENLVRLGDAIVARIKKYAGS